ncbi:FAD-dependent oxidoreductase [Cryptosporangium phraense]|uniref:D-amino-acid oxidase n=1 Tax=Cryptosporangium phraense TaxID=2593070 RepID=A0A545AUK6_9ACTN|nr:FAD-dependent oxidoreductase [Cryptosporangium phraense]TQS45019.1 FAD-dependent oxidoreductase [Cryptosporangium phraense]
MADILVLGAGVSGLTTALSLADAGFTLRVVADRLPPDTTSAVAGAIWGPYVVSDDRVIDWSMRTWRRLREFSEHSGSGVRLLSGVEAATEEVSPPGWVHEVDGFALVGPGDLPAGYVGGWRYRAPAVEMVTYLGYLTKRLADRGVTVELIDPVNKVEELFSLSSIVVNCAGLGSRELVPDSTLRGIRGQLVVIDNPGLTEFFSDYPESSVPTYIVPQGDYVVLGGTIVQNDETLAPDLRAAEEIRARCAGVVPTRLESAVANAEIRAIRVGLRPARPRVRLEAVEFDDGVVVHNYGHGGSGITMSWGCADDARGLVQQIVG